MNALLQRRFEEIEGLLDERKALNRNLTRNVGLWTGFGAFGALALIGLTGGAAIAVLPATFGAIQVGKSATKGAIAGAQQHQKAQSVLDEKIRGAVTSLIADVMNQLHTRRITKGEAEGAYYRLKYMDEGFEDSLISLKKNLKLD